MNLSGRIINIQDASVSSTWAPAIADAYRTGHRDARHAAAEIAAAHEAEVTAALLAVCERFAACMRRGDRPDFLELISTLHDADAAIAKARKEAAQ